MLRQAHRQSPIFTPLRPTRPLRIVLALFLCTLLVSLPAPQFLALAPLELLLL